ncbi:MAG TPA: 50S ribosomal protein L9 [Bacteroidales bacterium]|jgi:large subunit ribosomal protein L9|nr:50S ribosomal protein L9 [Bacteroidales bacterium]MCZ2418009.1 50S ribosomal protein L9 [Burkholderiales bacterium]OQC58206.1 MAG: 50S ribosomal protein L9 [Bacteroidetes bacterium ADurb.Bin013]MBV6455975.1 50S ribosomal protein L9 [Bacteroidales bacterium]MCZ2316043.1 50S ribosomal protein L9 [Bacteroidales bacterium]
MEIILKQDVEKLGHKDDIVKVRNGYATNYLIPKGMAVLATPSAVKIHQENMRQRAHKETRIREDAQALAAKLAACQVRIATKVSSNGKVFGSVNNIQVAEALAAQGIEVDRRNITFTGAESLKEVGVHETVIKIYRDIIATIQVEVVGEE